jgi:hypothetical protein
MKNDYILFAKDNTVFQQPLSLSQCIDTLEDTDAYAFYFKLNAQDGMSSYRELSLIQYKSNVYAWNFAEACDQWASANLLDLVLHRKSNFLQFIANNGCTLWPSDIEYLWAAEGNLDHVGLCFGSSRVAQLT